MINLRCRTEYSFGTAYGPVAKVIEAIRDATALGITDRSGTWGHVVFSKAMAKAKKQPLFGVELAVVQKLEREKHPSNWMAFLARTTAGLQEIYELTTEATSETNFYYHPRIDYRRLTGVSRDIIILSGTNPRWDLLSAKQKNLFVELAPSSQQAALLWSKETGRPAVATSDNYYPQSEHRPIYEIVAGRNRDARTTPMHLLDEYEWSNCWPNQQAALTLTHTLAAECTASIPTAQPVKFKSAKTLEQLCREAAPRRGINLKDPVYAARLRRELDLIAEKDFEDYFYVIADMLQYAKQHMMVGPARGSSCGSLVCYLLSITEIDPIPFSLIFERFIDVNRKDLPDIDIDFADDRREMVFEYVRQKYGPECVARLGTVMRYKAKSAIDAVAVAMRIPITETEDLKNSIIERSGGDSRAGFCILDTFDGLEIGKTMLRKYPHLRVAADLEMHAKGVGQHAAGIVITQEPLRRFCSRNMQNGAIMVDKYDVESINLLKIDALGLRTLSVIQDALDQIGQTREWLMRQPLDDEAAFEVINRNRYAGIFQFEGYGLQSLCQQMKVENFEDIASLGAIGRPGPITSGAATEFIRRRMGTVPVTYLHPLCVESTKVTYGVVIYQEQVMTIGRVMGKLTWEDVSALRKAMSKSLGQEFFDQYWVRFLEGAQSQGVTAEDARRVWDSINSMGCLSGDTLIRNPFPNHVTPHFIKLKDLAANKGYVRPHKEWASESATGQHRHYSSEHRTGPKSHKGIPSDIIQKQQVYCQQQDGRIRPQRLVDCWCSGEKETWLLKVDSGESIRATLNHRFRTKDGRWIELGNLKAGDAICLMGAPPKGGNHKPFKGTGSGAHNPSTGKSILLAANIAILKKRYKRCTICHRRPYRETHHRDGDHSQNEPGNLQPVCRICHKELHRHMDGQVSIPHLKGKLPRFANVVSISHPKMEKVYDIQMPDPNNNFVANEFVVHNSWSFNRCLAGSTRIRISRGGPNSKSGMTIEDMYKRYVVSPKWWVKHHGGPTLASLYPDGRVRPQQATTIHQNGIKDLIQLKFTDGSKVVCTKDHRFIINDVWQPASRAKVGDAFLSSGIETTKHGFKGTGRNHNKGKKYPTPKCGFQKGKENISYDNGRTPEAQAFKQLMHGRPCQVCGKNHKRMESHHRDNCGGEKRPHDLAWLCPGCHKKIHYKAGRTKVWEKGHKTYTVNLAEIKSAGRGMTYDIEMPTHHNFALHNGIITHNSHAVAYGMVTYWCSLLKAHHPLEWATACLRNAANEEQCIKLLRELDGEGYKYKAFDPVLSEINWSVKNGQLIGGLLNLKGVGHKKAQDIMQRRKEGQPLTPSMKKLLETGDTPFNYDKVFEARVKFKDLLENPAKYNVKSKIWRLVDITSQMEGEFVFLGKIVKVNLRDANEPINVKNRGGKYLSGQPLYLILTVEDNTSSIFVKINAQDYLELGKPIVESGGLGQWFLWKGYLRQGFRKVFVKRYWPESKFMQQGK